jgi:hypothetical protein
MHIIMSGAFSNPVTIISSQIHRWSHSLSVFNKYGIFCRSRLHIINFYKFHDKILWLEIFSFWNSFDRERVKLPAYPAKSLVTHF